MHLWESEKPDVKFSSHRSQPGYPTELPAMSPSSAGGSVSSTLKKSGVPLRKGVVVV